MGLSWAEMSLGQRLKWVREKRLKRSAYRLVDDLKAVGVDIESHTTVYRYEKGRMPPADYVAALAELAGMTTDEIMRPGRAQGDAESDATADTRGAARHLAADLLEDMAARLREEAGRGAPEIPEDAYRPEPPPGERERGERSA